MKWPFRQQSTESADLDTQIEEISFSVAPEESAPPAARISVTPRAQEELRVLLESPDQFLRIWVESGGCAGMTYAAGIDDELKQSDHVVHDAEGLRMVVDPRTLQYVDGLEIDFSDDLITSGFRFQNPNAGHACGCGASFGT